MAQYVESAFPNLMGYKLSSKLFTNSTSFNTHCFIKFTSKYFLIFLLQPISCFDMPFQKKNFPNICFLNLYFFNDL